MFLENDDEEGELFYVLFKYISEYKNFNIVIYENENLLYKNVMAANCQNIFISDLIGNMNIGDSISYIYRYIFKLYKIPFCRYIKSCYKEKIITF